MTAALTIRVATPNDAARLAELSTQLGYPATSENILGRLGQILGDREHAVFVAEARERAYVVAWVHVLVTHVLEEDSQAEIAGLVVDEAWRGRGAGRLLMERAEQWAREQGCRAVRLRSNVIRAEAHAFYEKLGYQVIKSQKVFRKTL